MGSFIFSFSHFRRYLVSSGSHCVIVKNGVFVLDSSVLHCPFLIPTPTGGSLTQNPYFLSRRREAGSIRLVLATAEGGAAAGGPQRVPPQAGRRRRGV